MSEAKRFRIVFYLCKFVTYPDKNNIKSINNLSISSIPVMQISHWRYRPQGYNRLQG